MRTKLEWLSYGSVALLLALAGCSGDAGKAGADGADGMDGVDGAKGADGADGADGVDGADGLDGTNGTDGVDGMDGSDGDAGIDGTDGLPGVDGDMGVKGDTGDMGTPGTSGIINRSKLTGNYVVYPLAERQTSGITGDVRLAEFVDGTTVGTLITIRITGTNVANTIRGAHIHSGVVGGTGSMILVTLNKVDGFAADGSDTGVSETLVTNRDLVAGTAGGGAAITFAELTGFAAGAYTQANALDALVNVHEVSSDSFAAGNAATDVAAGNIGPTATPSDSLP